MALVLVAWPLHGAGAGEKGPDHYKAKLRPPASLAAILQQVEPGGDAFPEERVAAELEGRLRELGRILRAGGARDATPLLAADFRGARLRPLEVTPVARGALEVARSRAMSQELALDRAGFARELQALVAGMDEVRVAEFLITRIEVVRRRPGAYAGALRRRGRKPGGLPDRARRPLADRLAARRSARVAPVSWQALDQQQSRAAGSDLPRGDGGGARGEPVVPAPADPGTRPVACHHRLRLHAQLDGAPRRVGRGRRRRRPRRSLRGAAGRPARPPVPEQGRRHVRGRDREGGPAGARRDLAGDLRRRGQRRRPGPDPRGHGRGPAPVPERRQGALQPGSRRLPPEAQGTPMSIAMADYDRDGFLDVYLCNYSYFIGTSEDKGGSPNPYHDARNGPPSVLLRNDHGKRFVDVTAEAGLDQNNNRFSFAAAWADYDDDGWPDLLVANDFGRKNLYHNEGLRSGKVTFRDVTARAGVEDHGAGMSAAWVDYDDDGRLDIYTGNMWSANGRRITSEPGFMPDAPAEIKSLYQRHARGNSLFRNRGDGSFEDVTLEARAEMGRWAWCSDTLDFDRDGCAGPLRGERHVHARARRGPGRLLLAAGGGALAAHARDRHALRRRLARHQPAAGRQVAGEPPAQRLPAQRRPGRLRRGRRQPGPRPRPGRPLVRRPRLRRRRRPGPGGDGGALGAPAATVSERVQGSPRGPRAAASRDEEQPRRRRRARDGGDRPHAPHALRPGRLGLHLAALERAAVRPRAEPEDPEARGPLAERREPGPDRRPARPPGLPGRRRRAALRALPRGASTRSAGDGAEGEAPGCRRRPGSTSPIRRRTSAFPTSTGRSCRSRACAGIPLCCSSGPREPRRP